MAQNCTPSTEQCDGTLFFGNTYLIATIGAMGILNNALCIFVFTRDSLKSSFKGSVFTFMLGLSIIDFINCVLMFPFGVFNCECMGKNSELIRASYGTYIIQPIYNACAAASVWTTVAMSVDRLFFISKPVLSKTLCKPLIAKISIFAIVVLCLILHIPFFFQITFTKDGDMKYTEFGGSPGFKVYLWIRHIIVKFIPIISVAVLNSLLLITIIKARNKYRRTFVTGDATADLAKRQNIHERAKTKTTMLLVCICTVFLVCHTPEPFGHVPIFKSLFGECMLYTCAHNIYVMITNNLELLSYATPFYFHLCFNHIFRRTILKRVCCRTTKIESTSGGTGTNKNSGSKLPNSYR